ncbi:four-helix bundle copper-binding protein [Derxia gummosa]|uniref:Four-helix bundle copper-binding protein n=1 Tax=Derxia gummosa DSM 723 TaxID=1121388 RepID=A0A8B6X5Y4_9BURK|nr:four-helix bundle copper-binding protein [Derxia gummosa]
MDPTLINCADACDDCARACDLCAIACLAEDDPKPMAACIALDIDCAAICRLASAAMARGSSQIDIICELCATICAACADECGQHPMDHCQRCAKACRDCASACREMLAVPV